METPGNRFGINLGNILISAVPTKLNARGCFDSQTIILLRKRLDNLNPAKRVKM